MVSLNELEEAIGLLHQHRSSLRLEAEMDPHAIKQVAHDFAERAGLDYAVALRVVENEIGVRPLAPKPTATAKRRTVVDVVAMPED